LIYKAYNRRESAAVKEISQLSSGFCLKTYS